MAEWTELNETAFAVVLHGAKLTVWLNTEYDEWCISFSPMLNGRADAMNATTAEAAKLEALHIVGEWAKSLAVEATELRGRMVDDELNAKGAEHDG